MTDADADGITALARRDPDLLAMIDAQIDEFSALLADLPPALESVSPQGVAGLRSLLDWLESARTAAFEARHTNTMRD